MNRREETVRLWFDMWLQKSDLGILNIFSEKFLAFWDRTVPGNQRHKKSSLDKFTP